MRTFLSLLFLSLVLSLSLSACVVDDEREPVGSVLLEVPPSSANYYPTELAPPPRPGDDPVMRPPVGELPAHACERVAESWCKMLRQCMPDADVDLEACRAAELDACCEATLDCQLDPADVKVDACVDGIEGQTCPGTLTWPEACEWAAP